MENCGLFVLEGLTLDVVDLGRHEGCSEGGRLREQTLVVTGVAAAPQFYDAYSVIIHCFLLFVVLRRARRLHQLETLLPDQKVKRINYLLIS